MLSWGDFHKNDTTTGSFDEKLLSTYYDGAWVYFRLGDYTGDSAWYTTALAFGDFYRDQYVVPNSGGVPGYWNFTNGLTEDYLRNGDTASRDAVRNLLAVNAAFAADTTPLSATASYLLSREVAYTIVTYLNAERCGASRRVPRLADLLEQALGHMDQWFVSQSAGYVRPFMCGLTMWALTVYNETIGDSRILPLLKIGAEWLMQHAWLPADLCFMYTDRVAYDGSGGQEPAPDLNLLILPVYGYIYHQTGETKWIDDYGDKIFQGGVVGAGSAGNPSGAYLAGTGKQFNQNYRTSFDYVIWREAAPLTEPPGGGDPPPPSTSTETFSIVVPVKRRTWAEKFAEGPWATIREKIDAGYPIYCQPTALTAQFIITIDLEAVIDSATTIAFLYNVETIEGVVTATPGIAVSADNVTFTEYPGVSTVLASNFRYVRLSLDFEGDSDKALARVRDMRRRLYLKKKTDEGFASSLATDAGGTLVLFNKTFADVTAVIVTPVQQSGVKIGWAMDFEDEPNPVGFRALFFDYDTGSRIDADFSWIVRGV